MVLHHVPQTAGAFIKRSAVRHAEIFRHGYLDTGHEVAVPDRLQERIGEAEIEDVHDRLFSKEVIDAEDRIFRKHRARHLVEIPGRSEVTSERLFYNNARVVG